jgi:hypothetical protein
MPTGRIDGGTSESAKRSATRFFWYWLVVATSMSVCGNVAHALLIAPAGYHWMAAVAALVPPTVLIAGNHSISALVRTRAGGTVYWVALLATVLLALGAFVLSFDALRSLAVLVGIRASIAWIWPAVIDVAIAQASLCLLSLTRSSRATTNRDDGLLEHDVAVPTVSGSGERIAATAGVALAEGVAPPPPRAATLAAAGPATLTQRANDVPAATAPTDGSRETVNALSVPVRERPLSAVHDSSRPTAGDCGPLDTAAVRRWQPVADSLVRDGVTPRTEPQLVAIILAEREAGTRAATIEKRHNVHHSTVKKVLAAADQLTGRAGISGQVGVAVITSDLNDGV